MTDRLTDKVALITGSDSGIGQATATDFVNEGADVVVTYLEDEAGARETVRAYASGSTYYLDGPMMQNQGQGA